jgi:hypothetical protein
MRRPRAPGNSRLEAAAKFFVGITVVSVLTVAVGPRLVIGARRLVEETVRSVHECLTLTKIVLCDRRCEHFDADYFQSPGSGLTVFMKALSDLFL